MPEIALHILDLVENSITALASEIRILLNESVIKDILVLMISDNGKGMSESFLKGVTSPFTTTRTTRKVGMGIPLLKAGCEATGGSFEITSKLGEGTSLKGTYVLSHIDRPPLGNITETIHMLIVCNPDIDIYFEVKTDDDLFYFDTKEIRKEIGDMPLNTPEISVWMREYIDEGVAALKLLG